MELLKKIRSDFQIINNLETIAAQVEIILNKFSKSLNLNEIL